MPTYKEAQPPCANTEGQTDHCATTACQTHSSQSLSAHDVQEPSPTQGCALERQHQLQPAAALLSKAVDPTAAEPLCERRRGPAAPSQLRRARLCASVPAVHAALYLGESELPLAALCSSPRKGLRKRSTRVPSCTFALLLYTRLPTSKPDNWQAACQRVSFECAFHCVCCPVTSTHVVCFTACPSNCHLSFQCIATNLVQH